MRKPKLADIVTYRSATGNKCQGYIARIKHDEQTVTVIVTRLNGKPHIPTPAEVDFSNLLSIRAPDMIRLIDRGSHYESIKVPAE